MIYFSIYQIYNNCYSLARVWPACDRTKHLRTISQILIFKRYINISAAHWLITVWLITKICDVTSWKVSQIDGKVDDKQLNLDDRVRQIEILTFFKQTGEIV